MKEDIITIRVKVPEDKYSEAMESLTKAKQCFDDTLERFVEVRRLEPTLASACETKFQELTELFYEKNEQYGDKDPLANFRNGAMMMYGNDSWQSMYEAAKCYAMKHVAHIFGKGQTIGEEKVGESLGDLAVYCAMMQFMVEQWKEEEKR